MKEQFHSSYEIATIAIGLIATIAGSLLILLAASLVIVPVLIVEALQKCTQWFQSRNQTT